MTTGIRDTLMHARLYLAGGLSERGRGAIASAWLIGMAALALPACDASAQSQSQWCEPRCGNIISDWSLTAYQTIKLDSGYENPLPATRALTMMHLAMHDAANAAASHYQPYTMKEQSKDADAAVAAISAAHEVLLALYPSQQAFLNAELSRGLLDAGIGERVVKGRALGKTAAQAILDLRADDGSAGTVPYAEKPEAGKYRFVPGTDFIIQPHWRSVRPFALTSPDQFRLTPPPALTSAGYAAAFDEVKLMGGKNAPARTQDQTLYAAFWYELSDIGWNRIARSIVRDRNFDLWSSARTFALLNMALSDSYIAGWDSKLHYDFWRPVTAIRMASDDGNAQTDADAAWDSFLPTPPIQDYPSTHSTLGAAAAVILAEVSGNDTVEFSATSTTALPDQPSRSFSSFSQAARENADSRVRAGLHFRFASDGGLKLGELVGRHTSALLPPLD